MSPFQSSHRDSRDTALTAEYQAFDEARTDTVAGFNPDIPRWFDQPVPDGYPENSARMRASMCCSRATSRPLELQPDGAD